MRLKVYFAVLSTCLDQLEVQENSSCQAKVSTTLVFPTWYIRGLLSVLYQDLQSFVAEKLVVEPGEEEETKR